MEPAIDIFKGPKEPKPAKAPPPPTRDQAADAAQRKAEEEEKRRALLSRGAQGTIFAGGAGLQLADTSAPKVLTGQ